MLHCIKGVQQNRSFPEIPLLSYSRGARDAQPGLVRGYSQCGEHSVLQPAAPGPQLRKTLISLLALLLICCVSQRK